MELKLKCYIALDSQQDKSIKKPSMSIWPKPTECPFDRRIFPFQMRIYKLFTLFRIPLNSSGGNADKFGYFCPFLCVNYILIPLIPD